MSSVPPGPKTLFLNGVPVGVYESTGDDIRDAENMRNIMKEKGFDMSEPPLADAIFQQAAYFAETSSQLYMTEINRPAPRRPMVLIPFVVNSTFAIELYLKAISQRHGKSLRGHELTKLYDDLPALAKDRIKSKIPEIRVKRKLQEEPDVRLYLSELNTAFVDWRYSFEKSTPLHVRLEPILFLLQTLHEAGRKS